MSALDHVDAGRGEIETGGIENNCARSASLLMRRRPIENRAVMQQSLCRLARPYQTSMAASAAKYVVCAHINERNDGRPTAARRARSAIAGRLTETPRRREVRNGAVAASCAWRRCAHLLKAGEAPDECSPASPASKSAGRGSQHIAPCMPPYWRRRRASRRVVSKRAV